MLLLLMCSISFVHSIENLVWQPINYPFNEPPCRSLHTTTALSNENCSFLLHFGGFSFPIETLDGSGPLKYHSDTWLFAPTKQQWVNFSDFSFSSSVGGRGGHSTFADPQNSIFFSFGGTNGIQSFNDVWVLDTSGVCQSLATPSFLIVLLRVKWRQLLAEPLSGSAILLPESRWGHAGMLFGGSLIIFGGISSPLRELSLFLSYFAPLASTWCWN